jgi:thiamine-phosphate pyrophosphorylase
LIGYKILKMHILAISPGLGAFGPNWEAIANSGIDALMIREKGLSAKELLDLGKRVRDMAPHLALWVADRLDIAIAIRAGYHAGEDAPPAPPSLCPISRPLHSMGQMHERDAKDQLLISPIFHVPGKGTPIGAKGLHEILDNMPQWKGKVLALGGIGPENVGGIKHPKLDGIALIRSLWESSSPSATVEALRRTWEEKTC